MKKLGCAAAAVACSADLLSDRVTAKRAAIRYTLDGTDPTGISPEWVNAPYEVSFLFHKDAFKAMQWTSPLEISID